MRLVGLIVGLKAKAGEARLAKWLILLMSRAGLEPATHWLKAGGQYASAVLPYLTLPPASSILTGVYPPSDVTFRHSFSTQCYTSLWD